MTGSRRHAGTVLSGRRRGKRPRSPEDEGRWMTGTAWVGSCLCAAAAGRVCCFAGVATGAWFQPQQNPQQRARVKFRTIFSEYFIAVLPSIKMTTALTPIPGGAYERTNLLFSLKKAITRRQGLCSHVMRGFFYTSPGHTPTPFIIPPTLLTNPNLPTEHRRRELEASANKIRKSAAVKTLNILKKLLVESKAH